MKELLLSLSLGVAHMPSARPTPVAADQAETPAQAQARRVVSALRLVSRLSDRAMECGGASACPPDRMYYEKDSLDAQVDLNASLVEEFILKGKPEGAAAAVRGVAFGARLYDGSKLVPRGTRVVLAAEVQAQLERVLAIIPGR